MPSQTAKSINADEVVRRAVTMISEALKLLDSVDCKSAGAALLDHAMHTLIADFPCSSDGLHTVN